LEVVALDSLLVVMPLLAKTVALVEVVAGQALQVPVAQEPLVREIAAAALERRHLLLIQQMAAAVKLLLVEILVVLSAAVVVLENK
jgi:hypothetical protein